MQIKNEMCTYFCADKIFLFHSCCPRSCFAAKILNVSFGEASAMLTRKLFEQQQMFFRHPDISEQSNAVDFSNDGKIQFPSFTKRYSRFRHVLAPNV